MCAFQKFWRTRRSLLKSYLSKPKVHFRFLGMLSTFLWYFESQSTQYLPYLKQFLQIADFKLIIFVFSIIKIDWKSWKLYQSTFDFARENFDPIGKLFKFYRWDFLSYTLVKNNIYYWNLWKIFSRNGWKSKEARRWGDSGSRRKLI